MAESCDDGRTVWAFSGSAPLSDAVIDAVARLLLDVVEESVVENARTEMHGVDKTSLMSTRNGRGSGQGRRHVNQGA